MCFDFITELLFLFLASPFPPFLSHLPALTPHTLFLCVRSDINLGSDVTARLLQFYPRLPLYLVLHARRFLVYLLFLLWFSSVHVSHYVSSVCSGLEIVYNKAGDKALLAEATLEQVHGWAMVIVGVSKKNADRLLEQEIRGRHLVELAKLRKAEIEAKLLAAPNLLSFSAALDLAKAISEFASTTTGVSPLSLSLPYVCSLLSVCLGLCRLCLSLSVFVSVLCFSCVFVRSIRLSNNPGGSLIASYSFLTI
jgi:hypothetical protein